MEEIEEQFLHCGLQPLKKLSGDDDENVYLAVDLNGKFSELERNVVVKTLKHPLNLPIPNFVLLAPYLRNANVVKAYKVFRFDALLYTIFEYAPLGDLAPLVRRSSPHCRKFSEQESHSIFIDILNGLTYLHANHIAHRDIKLNNVLLFEDMTAKLTDFGLSKLMIREGKRLLTDSTTGTPGYQPPEVIAGELHNPFIADVFSLGVLLFILMTGESPFDDDLDDDLSSTEFNNIVIERIGQQYARLDKVQTTTLRKLIARMLKPRPLDRLLLRQVHVHPWTQSNNVHKLLVRTQADYKKVQLSLNVREQLDKVLQVRNIEIL